MVRYIVLALFLIVNTGCAHWDNLDKTLYGSYLVGSVVDIATTQEILNNGGCEKNPIMDGNDAMVPVKVGVALGVLYIADKCDSKTRKWLLGIVNFIQWGVVVHNCNEIR